MSWNRSKEDDKSSGSGLATGLVAAGGIAAAGFLLYKLFSDNKPEHPPPSRSSTRRESTASWGGDVDNTVREVERGVVDLGNTRHATVTTMGVTKKNHRSLCTLCHKHKVDVVLGPCNHSVCEDCAEQIDAYCPSCYKAVTTMKPCYV